MGLEFLRAHGAQRMASYAPLPPTFDPPDAEDETEDVAYDYELPLEKWRPVPPHADAEWRVREWAERPVRFIDGKDVGETVAWLRSPEGYPVPVRLAEIGGVAVRVEDGAIRREVVLMERVVAMVADVFAWDAIEGFAIALREHGFRLLPARPLDGVPSYDFERMRKAAQNRSNDDMGLLEEAALLRANLEPTVVDGRLEPRQGGIDRHRSPVVGVIKTLREEYLQPHGIQVRFALGPGERTPAFVLAGPSRRLPVVSWYLRLSGTAATMPNWGIVRIEIPYDWFHPRKDADGFAYVAQLSRLLCAYRTTEGGYGRAPVSLHPIVRAEQLLGALFTPSRMLGNSFCRLVQL